jgi:hypothetical protein
MHSDNIELAIRMAIGNTRVNRWKNIRHTGYQIGDLFDELNPNEQQVSKAWEVILNAPDELLTLSGNDIMRQGTGVAELDGYREPSVITGFLSFVSRNDWELSPCIYSQLRESGILNREPEPDGVK